MTSIIIHGVLGKIYGKKHKLKVRRINEIISAINANNPGFRNAILSNLKSNMDYVFVDPENPKKEYKKPEDFLNQRPPKEIHIVPCIFGSGLIAIAVGTGLLKVAGLAALKGTFLGKLAFNLGVSLILQGLNALLFPPPEPPERQVESKLETSSYIFSNFQNNAVQGFPVPLVYGEIKVGSNVISTNIISEDADQE